MTSQPEIESVTAPAITNADQAPAIKRMSLRYTRDLLSGFGDRIMVLTCIAAAARAVDADVYAYWVENTDRFYPLRQVQESVIWPRNLRVTSKQDFERLAADSLDIQFNLPELLISTDGYDGVYTLAWRTIKLPADFPPLTQASFLDAYRQVAREFDIRLPPTSIPFRTSRVPYAVLHLRGDDKQANVGEFCTTDVLKQWPPSIPIIVITDDLRLRDRILRDTPAHVRIHTVPQAHIDPMSALLLEFRLLMRASAIVQHSPYAWSSFSSIPAILKQVPLLNTWMDQWGDPSRSKKRVGRLQAYENNGGCPDELISANNPAELERFLAHVQSLSDDYFK